MDEKRETGEKTFAEWPMSITEAKAEKCNEWTPRDALIATLREIDNGRLDIETMVIAYWHNEKRFGYRIVAPDGRLACSLLDMVKQDLITEED